jgi:DNA-binding MarR family transcriptional regulator
MNEEKEILLLEMIAFSAVDGHLDKKEYEFLFFIANELNIEKGGFNDLLQQFYRLALLLYKDGLLYLKEARSIKQIAVRMGLNPEAAKRVVKKMEKAPNSIIPSDVLFKIFREERN